MGGGQPSESESKERKPVNVENQGREKQKKDLEKRYIVMVQKGYSTGLAQARIISREERGGLDWRFKLGHQKHNKGGDEVSRNGAKSREKMGDPIKKSTKLEKSGKVRGKKKEDSTKNSHLLCVGARARFCDWKNLSKGVFSKTRANRTMGGRKKPKKKPSPPKSLARGHGNRGEENQKNSKEPAILKTEIVRATILTKRKNIHGE